MPFARSQLKSLAAEAALPAFDFASKVGRKIALQKFRRAVVLCVVDVADFDGSLPRDAVRWGWSSGCVYVYGGGGGKGGGGVVSTTGACNRRLLGLIKFRWCSKILSVWDHVSLDHRQ